MGQIHRNGDARTCGASTVVNNQSTVFANGRLIAVRGTVNSHGGGALINSGTTVFIEGKPVIIRGDSASPDGFLHPNPAAASGSGNVFAY